MPREAEPAGRRERRVRCAERLPSSPIRKRVRARRVRGWLAGREAGDEGR